MVDSSLLIVLPTLGERLYFLELALRSAIEVSRFLDTTIVMVVPADALEARRLGERYGAVIVDDPAAGMAEAINVGLRVRSSEEFYVWVGDDDQLVGSGVKKLVDALSNSQSAVAAYGYCDYIDTGGNVIARNRAGKLARFLIWWGPNLIPHPGTVIRLKALRDVGGYDSAFTYALDLDLILRLIGLGELLFVPSVSARFRWHEKSLTVSFRSESLKEASIIKRLHTPSLLKPLTPLWIWPSSLAVRCGAYVVNARLSGGLIASIFSRLK